MAEQERREFRRRELADLLERLAKEVRRGAVELEGHHLMVPEVMEARMEVKAKKGRVTANLAPRWPAAPSTSNPRRPRSGPSWKVLKN